MRKLTALLTLMMLLIISACSGNSSTTSKSNGNGSKEITYATTSDVAGLSPIMTNDTISSNVNEQMYETLFTRNWETDGIFSFYKVTRE